MAGVGERVSVIAELIRAGVAPELVAKVSEALIEASRTPLKPRQAANRRAYLKRLSILKTTETTEFSSAEIDLKSTENDLIDNQPRAPIRAGVHDPKSLEVSKKERIRASPLSSGGLNGHQTDLSELRSKPKRDTSQADAIVDSFLRQWDAVASQTGLAKCRAVTDRRRSCILARGRDCTEALGFASPETGFVELIAKIRGSPLLLGQTGGNRTWKCSLDWVVNETNFLKIMEGNYAAKPANQPYGSLRL